MGGTGREQHGHAADVANNSPVGCCLARGSQSSGMSTKKALPAGAPFAEPQLDGTGQEQCKSEPFVKNKGRVSSWRWYPAFFASGMVFRLMVWYTRLNKSEFIEVFRMKQKVPMICNIVSLILLIVFVIKSIVDYTQYSTSLNSAPFYLWVLVNALFLVIPAIILFVIGFVVKKKQ